jgi:hypothetical protein
MYDLFFKGNIIQLMTLDEVNTTTYQPQRYDYHLWNGRGDNHISGVDKSWY